MGFGSFALLGLMFWGLRFEGLGSAAEGVLGLWGLRVGGLWAFRP